MCIVVEFSSVYLYNSCAGDVPLKATRGMSWGLPGTRPMHNPPTNAHSDKHVGDPPVHDPTTIARHTRPCTTHPPRIHRPTHHCTTHPPPRSTNHPPPRSTHHPPLHDPPIAQSTHHPPLRKLSDLHGKCKLDECVWKMKTAEPSRSPLAQSAHFMSLRSAAQLLNSMMTSARNPVNNHTPHNICCTALQHS